MNSKSKFSLRVVILGALVSVCVTGCHGSDPDSATVSAAAPDTVTGPNLQPKKDENGTKIVNSPNQAAPGDAISLRPANPNDPRYKPAPGMVGGG